jgi:hypothetical protein
MSHRHAVALVAAVCLSPPAALSPAVALGADVGSARLRALASAAATGDPGALARLRAVTSVDGRPAALGQLMGPGTATQLRLRALTLARDGGPAAPAVPAARAQAAAAAILEGSGYGKATNSDPVENLLAKLGRWLATLAAGTPGGPAVFWALAAAAVLALAAYGARRTLRRLEPASSDRGTLGEEDAEDPSALERDARSAEQRGAFGEAVRLRFRAGLLTLGARSAIEYRPSLRAAEVARSLHSAQFDSLNDTFERIAYGGAAARPGDAEASRDGWAAVLSRRKARP